MRVGAVIAAGGMGTRMGYKKNKILMPVLGKEIILYTLKAFSEQERIDEIVLVTGSEDLTVCAELVKAHGLFKVKKIIAGGSTRQESVRLGLESVSCDVVCIHDGARCLVSERIINDTIAAAECFGAAAPGVKCKDTLKSVDGEGFVEATVDREKTVLIQTPQVFNRAEILECHKRAAERGISVTDDCALAELYGIKIKITAGEYENLKITTPEDVLTAERILTGRRAENENRTGL